MNLWEEFWNDESGLIVSAEAVTVGTVGVLGAIVGLNAAGSAVNGELKEMAGAIRSLDQSYAFAGHRGCGAWTAGSYYIQPNVQQSLAELCPAGETDVKAIQQQIDADRKANLAPAPQPKPIFEATPAAIPNQIPVPESNKPVDPVKPQ